MVGDINGLLLERPPSRLCVYLFFLYHANGGTSLLSFVVCDILLKVNGILYLCVSNGR